MKLKKVSMSMRDLCYLLSDGDIDNQPNVGIEATRSAFVKTPTGELVKINQVIKKTDVEMIQVNYNETKTICAKTHGFLDESGKDVYAKDAKNIMTINGPVSVDSKQDVIETDAYDISIAAPHLYYTSDGTIHHNTLFGLVMASAYMKAKPEAICLFYDSEFGAGKAYFESVGIDPARVIHTPIMNIEELKFDIVQQLEEITEKDDVIIFIDSIGNLASKKEVEDAKDSKSVADLTRAKQMKSLWRMVTPYLNLYDIPVLAVNHTYQCGTKEMSVSTPNGNMSLKDVVKGTEVYTTEGIQTVTWVTKHEAAHITDIEMADGSVLSFTSGHKFKVDGKWVLVEDLKVGDNLDEF